MEMVREFKKIKCDAATLQRFTEENPGNDLEYWKKLEALVGRLRDFLELEWILLDHEDFLDLCCLVSKYRPIEPHSFLTRVSMAVNHD